MLAVAGVMLASPALWNRFPLTFYDTSSYLSRAVAATEILGGNRGAEDMDHDRAPRAHDDSNREDALPYQKISHNPFFLRPIFYSIFLIPFSRGLLFYLAPVAQGVAAAYAVRRLLDVLGFRDLRTFWACIAALAVGSSLPIHVSYVMPDVFTGIFIVLAFATVAGWRAARPAARVRDVLILAGLVAVHLSHVLIGAMLVGALLVGWLVARRFDRSFSIPLGGIGAIAASVALAVSALMGSNLIGGGKATLSESSPLFLLARLIGDGPALAYLERACPTEHYLLCQDQAWLRSTQQNPLASDSFLWSGNGTVQRLASPKLLDEAAEINRRTIAAYPVEIATNAARNAVRQFFTFQIDDSLNVAPPPFLRAEVRNAGQGLEAALMDSRQAQGQFPLGALRVAMDAALALALAAIAVVAVRNRRQVRASVWSFAAFALVGLVANAAVTGALSQVHDRYQNRVIWLVALTAVVLVAEAIRRGRLQPEEDVAFRP